MPTYTNGRAPESLMIVFATGTDGDGPWKHLLPPSTYRKHLALVARARARTGRTLAPTPGWSCYRPYTIQVIYRDRYGNGAAVPGTSSHGLFWEGAQVAAIDYGNWASVYSGFGGQAAFYADARAVGLEPGLISKARGYPDEPWHVTDRTPWATVPASTTGTPFPNTEEDDMLMLKIAGAHLCALGPGIFRHFIPQDPFDKIMRLSRSADDWQDVSLAELPALLATYGCDLKIWDIRNGAFVILNPLDGTVKSGNTWSGDRAVRAAIAGLKVPPVDPTPIVAAVQAALAAGDDVDEAAIAKAVNDEADRRNNITRPVT